jgi:hypothetical protein
MAEIIDSDRFRQKRIRVALRRVSLLCRVSDNLEEPLDLPAFYAMLDAYADELLVYPLDRVLTVLDQWPHENRYVPTLEQLKAAIDTAECFYRLLNRTDDRAP